MTHTFLSSFSFKQLQVFQRALRHYLYYLSRSRKRSLADQALIGRPAEFETGSSRR
jgi:hypothetical protein